MFNDAVNVSYIYKAGKTVNEKIILRQWKRWKPPRRIRYLWETRYLLMCMGANRAGIRTILVKPIHPKEEIQIVLKRYLEKIVLFFLYKEEKEGRKIMKIGIGNDHSAVEMKFAIKKYLEEMGHEVVNYGTDSTESCDYPSMVKK